MFFIVSQNRAIVMQGVAGWALVYDILFSTIENVREGVVCAECVASQHTGRIRPGLS
jgi:hypothetical protein